jgi:hypothetical protein
MDMIQTYEQGALYAIAAYYQILLGALVGMRQGLERLLRRELSRLVFEEENHTAIENAIWENVS